MKIPTIKIKAESECGYQIINKSDFDETKHFIYEPQKEPETKTTESVENPLVDFFTIEQVEELSTEELSTYLNECGMSEGLSGKNRDELIQFITDNNFINEK